MTWHQQAAGIIAEATRALPNTPPAPALPDQDGRRGAPPLGMLQLAAQGMAGSAAGLFGAVSAAD